jgi:hypothetical protein
LSFVFVAGALLAVASPARGASYDNLVERGRFYLSRGRTYGADAVRSLESARDADPLRAQTDPDLQAALARAYTLTARHTEAFWVLQSLGEAGALAPAEERLREQLLGETGLGRVRVVSAVPVGRLPARLQPRGDTRLDVAGRKILERLNELLARGITPLVDGLTLLVPEGVYDFSVDTQPLYAPREPVKMEVWAGDEIVQRLVPLYPSRDGWSVKVGSRTVELGWQELPRAGYRLFRLGAEGDRLVYSGDEPRYVDRGLDVSSVVEYRLEISDPQGALLAASLMRARTLPPVSVVTAEAWLTGSLTVQLNWTLGPGAADRVRVVREEGQDERIVAEGDAAPRGTAEDGPFVPAEQAQKLRYRVEAWIFGEARPAVVAVAVAEVPPLVVRVTGVGESVDRGVMIVGWETLPRDGLAEGYAVFRQRGEGTLGELVGRVRDPFAREFEYPVEAALDAVGWRHFVVPYIGERMLFDPDWLKLRGEPPEKSLERRARSGFPLPDMGLSWDLYPGAQGYLVVVGEHEELVKDSYVEISGLQNTLAASEHPVEVFAVDRDGVRVPLLRIHLEYLHYPRTRKDRMTR